MKKNVLAIIFASLLISAATLLTACKTDELDAKIDDNASKVETSISDLTSKTAADIKTAADKAADDLAVAKAELNAAIANGDKTNADELSAKVTELNTAIENANKALTDAKTALETALANDAKALEDAQKALNDAIAKGDKANADALDAKVKELNTAIEANKKSLTDTKAALEKALADTKANLQKSIDAVSADLVKKADELDKLIKTNGTNITALQTAKTDLEKDIANVKTKLDVLYKGEGTTLEKYIEAQLNALKETLNTSIGTTDAAGMKIENWNEATDDVIDALVKAGTINAAADRDNYTEANAKKLDTLYAEVQVRLLRSPTKADCATVIAKYEQSVKDVLTIGEVEAANKLNERIANLTATIASSGYTNYVKTEFARIKADLATWEEKVGEVNYEEVDREKLAKLEADYAAAEEKFSEANKAITDKINAFLGDYTYVYTSEEDVDDYYAMDDVVAAYKAWYKDVDNRQLISEVADIIEAYNEFNNGPHKRAHELHGAATEGAKINAKIEALTKEITNLKLIKSQYQKDLAEINELIADFDDKYFSGAYAAEAVEGNTNYNLVDRAAKAELDKVYDEKLGEVFEAAEALKACMNKLDVITTESKADITAANEAWVNFAKHLGDLGYDIDGLATADVVVATLTSAEKKCDELIAEGNDIIEEIKTLNKKADDLVDDAVRAAYKASYDEIVAKADAFVAKNNKIDYFKDYRDTLAAADKAIKDAAAISDVKKAYNELVDAIADFDKVVKDDIKAKADASFKAASEAIVNGDESALKLANAKLELLAHAADEYEVAATSDVAIANNKYKLAIATAYEQIEKSIDSLEAAKGLITETFAATVA